MTWRVAVAVALGSAGCAEEARPDPSGGPWLDTLPEYADYTGTGGGDVGDHVAPFLLVDQEGRSVDTRQFLGSVHVIDVAGVWCEPCQESAATSEVLSSELAGLRGSWLVTVLVQDLRGGPPGDDDAASWADTFELSYPVLADELQETLDDWEVHEWPTLLFVAPDGEIVDRADGRVPDDEVLARVQAVVDSHGDRIGR
jgi:thiol-disulfide isomerase/thioredoxin